MKRLNSKGFEPIWLILILILLALLGYAGWRVYYSSKAKDNSSKQSQQSQSESADAEEETAPATPDTYLVIKEWDVRVKLTDSIKTAYYLIKPDLPNYAYLSLEAFKNTDCAADQTTLGVYTRINNLSDVNNDTPGADGQTYAQMGYGTSPSVAGKYYYFTQPQSFCSNNETQDQAYWAEFKNALPTVEANP